MIPIAPKRTASTAAPSPAHTKVHAVGFVGDFVSSTVSNEGVPVFFRCVPASLGDT